VRSLHGPCSGAGPAIRRSGSRDGQIPEGSLRSRLLPWLLPEPLNLVAHRGDTCPMSSAPIAANQLDVVLRNVADGITAQRADGSLAYANDAAARLLGLESGEELINLPGDELMRRFTIIREDGTPMAPDELPNRRALTSRRQEE